MVMHKSGTPQSQLGPRRRTMREGYRKFQRMHQNFAWKRSGRSDAERNLRIRGRSIVTVSKREGGAMPLWVQAGGWGLLAGSALVLGAAIGWFAHVPQRAVAAVMAFGSGVLISALSFELMDEAYRRGGFGATALGFLGGSVVYT